MTRLSSLNRLFLFCVLANNLMILPEHHVTLKNDLGTRIPSEEVSVNYGGASIKSVGTVALQEHSQL